MRILGIGLDDADHLVAELRDGVRVARISDVRDTIQVPVDRLDVKQP